MENNIKPFHEWKADKVKEFGGFEHTRSDYYALYGRYVDKARKEMTPSKKEETP